MNISNKNLTDQSLTKRERRLLKRQQIENERLLSSRRKKIKKVIFILLPVILIAGGIIFSLLNYSPAENQGNPKIEIAQKRYNAGTVSMANGLVKHTYEIKNIGDGDLKIDRIWTSCHCTTARLMVGDKESPKFGMNNNPVFWSQKIAPNETGQLEVIFDPAFHGPQGTGPVVRVVYLSTNDKQNVKAEVRLSANVVQ